VGQIGSERCSFGDGRFHAARLRSAGDG
jgi:hypothetical protein